MGLQPQIKKKTDFITKTCARCGQIFGAEHFAPTKSFFYPDGVLPVCNDCIDKQLREVDYNWEIVDKFCQISDIPFVPKEFEKIKEMSDTDIFYRYALLFKSSEYDGLGWGDYYQAFKELKEQNRLEDELPELSEEKQRQLQERWGPNYDNDALRYLEELYNGLLTTQNINGKLQKDQALKICKMSYEIDCRIRAGEDFDKLLASYDKMVKAGEFTPKNVKNINDFDSCGELVKWLEKKGWKNKYYDNVPRDIVDETIANIQAFNRRLYTNESGIGEEITARIQALKSVEDMENSSNYYSTGSEITDLDSYDNDGYNELIKTEEFDPEGER